MTASLPKAQGAYVLARRHQDLIFTAGMTPRDNGVLKFSGKASGDAAIDSLAEAVVLAAHNAIVAATVVLRPSEKIVQVLNTTVYIACEPGFTRHSAVADLASAYLKERLGDAGVSARTAVGVASLPGDAPVEIQLVLAVGEAK